MKLIPFIFVFLLASCDLIDRNDDGSEIGNPLDGDTTILVKETELYISTQELAILHKFGNSFDVFKLRTYRSQLTAEEADIMDSMMVKAFNRVYYKGGN